MLLGFPLKNMENSLHMYKQLEHLNSRKHEKVAMFLTAHHVAGMLVAAVPVYVGTAHIHSFVLRLLLLVAAAALGLMLMIQVGGLAFYERVLWRVRGLARMRLTGSHIHPRLFSGTVVTRSSRGVLRSSGPIQIAGQHRPAASTPPFVQAAIDLGQTVGDEDRDAAPTPPVRQSVVQRTSAANIFGSASSASSTIEQRVSTDADA